MSDKPPFPDDENEPEEAPKYSLTNLPVLSEEQRKLVDENWQMDIGSLAKLVSGDQKQDGRSYWGLSVKKYLAGVGKEIKVGKKIIKGELILSEEQCNFIERNHHTMKCREMTGLLFPGEKLSNLSREYKAVYKYAKGVAGAETDMFDEPVDTQAYRAPLSLNALVGRVNQFVDNPTDHTKAMYDLNFVKPYDEKNLRALMVFLRTTRFTMQASSYTKAVDRELFESTFIRLVHDKASEITAGEVDLYISAATKTIAITRLERSIEGLQGRVDSALAGEDDKDGNKTRLSHSLVELINESHTKVNQYSTQLKALIDDLEGKRKDRIDGRNVKNSSILGLFEAVKNADEREIHLALGDAEKEEDGEVVKKFKGMDHVLGLVAGFTEEETRWG